MDIEALINHEYGIRTGLAVARLLPKPVAYRLARFLAARIAVQDQPMVRAVRSNQRVISGEEANPDYLYRAVHKVFEYRAYSIVDLYHNIQVQERIVGAVEFDDSAMRILELSQKSAKGMVVVIPHIGNYELAGLAASLKGGRAVALTLPEQPGGYKYHDKIRRDYDIEAVPASMASLKYATQVLREGGVVATGIDRPLPESGYQPSFFGRGASLPVHYVVLAAKANVPMVLAHVRRRADGKYSVSATDLVPVKEYDDRKTMILRNAEHMLALCERVIRQDPFQWAMFFDVWPEASPEVQKR